MGETLTLYGTLGLALHDAQRFALNTSIERLTRMLSAEGRASENLSFLNTEVEVRMCASMYEK